MFGALNTAVIGIFAEPIAMCVGGQLIETRGIFDSRHFEVQPSEGDVGISELVTTLAIDITDTGAVVAVGDTVIVRETTYRVADLRPDGQGMVVLDLEIVP